MISARPAPRAAGAVAVIVLLLIVGIADCGGTSRSKALRPGAPVIHFDVHRKLAVPDAQALAEISSTVAPRPDVLTHGDDMVAEPAMPVSFADAGTKRRFDTQMLAATSAGRRYASARAAAADGYVLASYFIPRFGVHWVKWSLVTKPFDPAHPAMLLYDGDGADAHLVALSYYLRSPNPSPPEGFAGASDAWHRHFGDCYGGGFVIGEGIGTADICTKIGMARAGGLVHAPVGNPAEDADIRRYIVNHPDAAPHPNFESNLVAGADVWMLHVWNVPSHQNSWGIFATANPALRTCTGACRTATS